MHLSRFLFGNTPIEAQQPFSLKERFATILIMIPIILLCVFIIWRLVVHKWVLPFPSRPAPERARLPPPGKSILRSSKNDKTKGPEKHVRFSQETLDHEIERVRQLLKLEHDETKISRVCKEIEVDPTDLDRSPLKQ